MKNYRAAIRTSLILVIITCVMAIISATSPALAADGAASLNPAALFHQANGWYEKGDYQQTIALYRRLEKSGLVSGNLYYNLGNSYFKIGQPGRAIYYYEKARRLIPGDSDLLANLAYVTGTIGVEPSSWTTDLWDWLTHRLPAEQSAMGASIGLFLLMALIVWAVLAPGSVRSGDGRGFRLHWLIPAGLAAVIMLVYTLFFGLTLFDQFQPQAVAVQAVTVRFEPSSEATGYFQLPEGSRVWVLNSNSGWRLIRRSDNKRGWVEAAALAQL